MIPAPSQHLYERIQSAYLDGCRYHQNLALDFADYLTHVVNLVQMVSLPL